MWDEIRETITLTLVVWRLTSLLVREDGPFDVFAKLRMFLGVRFNQASQMYGVNVLSRGIICFWCCSMWVSLAVALFASYSVNIHTFIAAVLVLSSLAILLDNLIAFLGRAK